MKLLSLSIEVFVWRRYIYLLKYGVGSTFACNTACILLGMDSYKFWIVASGMLYRCRWRTSSSCLTDDVGGNLILTLLSKTDHSVLMILKSGDCVGQERCWSASSVFVFQNMFCVSCMYIYHLEVQNVGSSLFWCSTFYLNFEINKKCVPALFFQNLCT